MDVFLVFLVIVTLYKSLCLQNGRQLGIFRTQQRATISVDFPSDRLGRCIADIGITGDSAEEDKNRERSSGWTVAQQVVIFITGLFSGGNPGNDHDDKT